MSRNIPEKLRYQVAAKAAFRCEYCLIPAEDSFFGFQVDHIISKKHGVARLNLIISHFLARIVTGIKVPILQQFWIIQMN